MPTKLSRLSKPQKKQLAEFLLDCINSSPGITTNELVELTDASHLTVSRLLHEIESNGGITKVAKECREDDRRCNAWFLTY